ncbi:MAG: HDOD domain-containing protein [Verrucomicrobiota bacterium]
MISHPINIDKIQSELTELPVAPQILPKLQTMVSDCNTNPDEIRDMIRLDPALSGMILKTANSAYFNPGYHIDSIDDAIMQLGFSDVYQIVTMLAFSDLLAGPLPTYGLGPGEFWKRSVACALAMERLARKYSEDPGVAYTIGLLHGIGMIFLEREIKEAPIIRFRSSLPEDVAVAKEEMEIFGINHAKVGAAMMRQWGFSDEIVVPVMCQFEPSEAGKHERMACLMSFAKRMIGTIISDPTKSVALPGPDPLLIALLHLTKDEYNRVVESLRERFVKVEGLVADGGLSTTQKTAERKNVAQKSMASNLGYGNRRIKM